jgi:LPS O-antigen subunit length determinant protein (WzzB/FepE family)
MNTTSTSKNNDEEFKKLLFNIWQKKLFIVTLTSIFSLSSVIYSLTLPNFYTSKATLAPMESEDSISSRLGSLSSLASLSGIGIPDSSNSKMQEAIARIKSYDFFVNYFLPNIKIENITSVKSWDESNNELIYNNSFYEGKDQKSQQDAYASYNSMLQLTEYKSNGFISLSIEHKSPVLAKKWLDIIIYNINESMRQNDLETAQNAINYLNESVLSTNIQSIKDVISNLLESQMQVLMLANSDQYYVLKVLDSPIVPEKKSSPNRALICILGSLIGAIFSILIIVLRQSLQNLKG